LFHRQHSPKVVQQLLAWYKIRDTFFGQNYVEQDMTKALELASVCEHPNAVWLTKLFAGREVASREEARQVFLGKTIQELFALLGCFGGFLRFVELLILAMRLRKRVWQCVPLMKRVFDRRKNLLLKGNMMVSSSLDIAAGLDLDANKTRKEQRRTFWLPRSLGMCSQWNSLAYYLTQPIRNDLFGMEELLQLGNLRS
jgi:hypothetical protein